MTDLAVLLPPVGRLGERINSGRNANGFCAEMLVQESK